MSIIKKFRITKIKNTKPLISLKKISLSFSKKHLVLDNISLDISKGQIIGLLGPNGAGKSSLMNIITGLIKPNVGEVMIKDQNINDYPIYLRTTKFKISLVPQIGGFFSDLSAEDNLNAVGEILIKDKQKRKFKIENLISKFELDVVRKVEAKFLSGGMKRRLVISMSLLGDPEILLMDEPFAALDPQTIQMLQNIIVTLQSEYGLTILITDHQARDLLIVCDKAIILSNSKIIADGTPTQLMNNKDATKYYFGENFKFR
jgi:lipopolysaccharide export system ATP-binding protein